MKRTVMLGLFTAALVLVPAGTASASPGGRCEGPVDVACRWHVCQPDELDCGMIPPCLLWVRDACVL